MGCAASKVEDHPAVALCRDRCKYLEEALSQTQSLSDAHMAYLASLRSLGPALHRFFHDINTIHGTNNGPQPPPPPPESKSDVECCSSTSTTTTTTSPRGSTSNPDTHLQFPYDSKSKEMPTPVNYDEDDEEFFRACAGGRAALKPPPPPPSPISPTWDFFNLFDAYERETYQLTLLYSCTSLDPEASAPADKIKVDDSGGNNYIIGDQKGENRPSENSKMTHSTTSTTPTSASAKQKKQSKQINQNKQSVGGGVPAAEAQVEAIMRELHLLFDRASESGNQVLLSLQPHHHTISLHQEYGFDDHEGLAMNSQSLSYTLHTLFLWEKKLYDEVKAEERLHVAHEKKSRILKQLEHNKGTATAAESPKMDSVRHALRSLLTKMKVSIQIVDRISITINKLRDEELWRQIIQFIHRLLEMWKAMLECHKSQYQAIAQGKGLDAIAISNAKLNDAHLATAIQLKFELQNWNVCFSNWIVTQKGFVKALNGWLLRCLLHEPLPQEDSTPDGTPSALEGAPLSPGGIGAPPAFVICNQWSQAMDRLSEKEVVEAIRGFCTSMHLLLMEHHPNVETLQQRMVTENKDLARKVRFLEEEEQKILQKVIQGRGNKKIDSILRGGDLEGGVRLQHEGENNIRASINLVWDLKQTMMAMEKFTAKSMQTYKELHAHIEQVSGHA